MPVYEYQCTSCDHEFEELVSMSGGTMVACPQCSSTTVTKLFSRIQRTRVGGDMPSFAAAGPAPRSGGCCGGGCGCH